MDKAQDCMTNFWRSAIRQQFHVAIDMLANAIQGCPDSSWSGRGQSPFWYLGFHTLIFLDLYLSAEGEPQFHPPPPFTRSELEDEVVVPQPAYGKDELLGYIEHCRKKLDAVMAGMTDAWAMASCPFPYRNMSNGELLLYNMRHLQHHAAQLNMRLRQETDSAPRWVSKGGLNIKA
jgi:uncharacterized damage-inducible protein DinB